MADALFGYTAKRQGGCTNLPTILIDGNFASAHGTLLMHPETLAQSLLQYLAGTALGQIRF